MSSINFPVVSDRAKPWLPSPRLTFCFGVLVAVIFAQIYFSRAVTQGIGLAVDYMPYTLPVEEWLRGDEFVVIHHPPLYSFTILLVAKAAQVEPFYAAEIVQWICYLLLPVLAGAVVFRLTPGARLPALYTMLTLATAPDVLDLGAQIASEHLFGIFTLGALAALIAHLAKGSRPWWLPVFGIFAALALLTRYAGGALVLVGAAVLLCQPKPWLVRCRESLLATSVAAAPCSLYILRNHVLHPEAVIREFGFKGIPWHKFEGGFRELATGWMPQPTVTFFSGALFIALCAAVWLVLAKRRAEVVDGADPRRTLALRVTGAFVAGYVIFILWSAMFADAWIPFDHRMLFPVRIAAVIACALAAVTLSGRNVLLRRVTACVLLVLALLAMRRGWGISADYAKRGIGVAGPDYQKTALAERARALPPDALVVSNRTGLAYSYTHRPVMGPPALYDFFNARPNPHVNADLDALAKKISAADDAYFIQFTDDDTEVSKIEDLFKRMPFQAVLKCPQGTLWHRVPRRGHAPP